MTEDPTDTAESDNEAFNNCTESDRWIVEAATAKYAARIGAGSNGTILTAAELIALSDREQAIYRGALAYLSGLEGLRSDGKVWQPRSATWEPADKTP